MEPLVFWAVLAAAFMHAGWNAAIKLGLDRFSSILLLALVGSVISAALLPFFPSPAPAAWPWILGSALLHTGYKLVLIRAYRHGDLSQIYPLARGAAPLIVTVAAVWWLGEAVTWPKVLAIASIALGVVVMSARGGAVGRMPAKAFVFAMLTAAFTAAYTLVDGVGARIAETASGFTLSMFLLDGVLMLIAALATRGRAAIAALRPAWREGLLAGGLSLGAYWIAIWAFTQAPIALVAALRESSVLFAMLIALVVLREKAGPWRWAAAGLIVAGIMLMRL